MIELTISEFENNYNTDDYEVYEDSTDSWIEYNKSKYIEEVGGFPDWKNPIEEILLISVVDATTRKAKVFGVKDYTGSYTDFSYVKCKDEIDLILKFTDFWTEDYPNIVTGWNTDGFDLPYMYARISRILGDSFISKLSPFGIVNAEERMFNDQVELNVDIVGVSSLDYLKVYKKFSGTVQENYKLETVIQEEIGLGKLENPYETFKEWYSNDWNLFAEYNYIDSERILRLEDKRNLLKLVVKMAYIAKVNYQDVFSPVRTWDTLIYNYLYDQNIIVPQSERSNSEETIEGAYVKEPIPGLYDWVISFDLNSLYPHIIMALNMSPETLNGMVDITVEQLLNGDFSKVVEGHSLAANGSLYSMSKSGFLPDLMRKLYNGRAVEKKQMLNYESELEKVRVNSSVEEIKRLESLITTKDSIQNALKTLMNSGYGALANKGFRFFDQRLAEGITKTGQLIIQTAERNANEYINKLTKINEDVVLASDTDSIYIHMTSFVDKFAKDKTKIQKVEFLEKAAIEKIVPYLNNKFNDIVDPLNWNRDLLVFKLEVVADRGFWSAKKKYALNVYSSEGVRYEKPKLKIKGLQIIQSSTPSKVRKYMKRCLEILLLEDQKTLHQYVRDVEQEYMTLSVEDIAYPRGVNNIKHFANVTNIYSKGTPIGVRAALLHNHYVNKLGLDKKYSKISEGDKVKFTYLKIPNPIHENVIAFNGKLPQEFGIHKYVNYRMMFEKSFLLPIEKLLVHAGWTAEEKATLDGLFD